MVFPSQNDEFPPVGVDAGESVGLALQVPVEVVGMVPVGLIVGLNVGMVVGSAFALTPITRYTMTNTCSCIP